MRVVVASGIGVVIRPWCRVVGVDVLALRRMRGRHVGAVVAEAHADPGTHRRKPLHRDGKRHGKDDEEADKG